MKRVLFACAVLAFAGCSKPQETTGRADTAPDAPKASVVPAAATTAPPKAAPAPATTTAEDRDSEEAVVATLKKGGAVMTDEVEDAFNNTKVQKWEINKPGVYGWMELTIRDGKVVGMKHGVHDTK